MKEKSKRGRKKKEPDYNNVFSVRLRELIKEKNVTQQEISKKITASRQALNKWVNGETIPDILAAAELADYFEVSLDYLTGRGTTKSSNEDITITRNVTGLTEEAINKIIMIGDFDKSLIDALNSFILTDCCVSLLMGFSMYENERNKNK